MPAVNHVILASGAVVVVSVAVATAIAIYESPEVRRYAEDVRRRIAIAMQSMGNGMNSPHREPRFNRPEDADGFMYSLRGDGAEPGVDADEESRRRQREELMYWNSMRLQQQEKELEEKEKEGRTTPRPTLSEKRGSTFDDFLSPDKTADNGTYIYNTGADAYGDREGLRRRGEGVRAFNPAVYANPFADENLIDDDEVQAMGAPSIAPGKDEIMSDIYSATERDVEEHRSETLAPTPALIDVETVPSHTESAATLDRELADDEYMVAGQDNRNEAYASIQAWAQEQSHGTFSPLPQTPAAPMSEPELVSDGELTPTDSMSLAGSGEDVANDLRSARDDATDYDVMSESEGMATPASWSEVGSVISESDIPLPAHA